MPKKWTTLRKIDDPQEEAEETQLPPTKETSKPKTRVPRRLRSAREGLIESPFSIHKQLEADLEEEEPEVEEPIDLPPRPIDIEEPRILIVNEVASTFRLIEETFENFSKAKVDTTSDLLSALEMTIVREYQLFIIGLELSEMNGPFFYEMVSKVYKTGLSNTRQVPAVVFVREPEDPAPSDDLLKDVRVKAVWAKPLNIERMLDSVSSVIQLRQR